MMTRTGLTAEDRERIEAYLSKPAYDREFADLIPADDEERTEDDASTDRSDLDGARDVEGQHHDDEGHDDEGHDVGRPSVPDRDR
ncbi:hypothetical protein [Halorubellus salinus]|uniref:hypothetical protein n=1 Tax=Halorubellus salinus TaxID=755309 RepID=UPI001D0976F4|nr:hypothetical protein [Halorubellus salinus]